MDKDMSKEMRKDIGRTLFWPFLYMAGTFIFGQLTGPVLPEGVKPFADSVTQLLICILAVLFTSGKAEKGWLCGRREKMPVRSFLVLLGAIQLVQLISGLIVAPLVMLIPDPEKLAKLAEGLRDVNNTLSPTFVLLGIAAPILEEIMFRGVTAGRLEKYGTAFMVVVSSLVFALFHANIIQLFTTFLPGIVLCYTCRKYSIRWSMLLHLINNLLIVIVLPQVFEGTGIPLIADHGVRILQAVLIVIGVIAAAGDKPSEKIRAFLKAVPNEKGAYQAAFTNVWLILMIVMMAGMTALLALAATIM